MTSHHNTNKKAWIWIPLRTDIESIQANTPKGQRLPTQPFNTHWVALGFYCSIFDSQFRRQFMAAIPVRLFEGTWYECLYDAMTNLNEQYERDYYLRIVQYLCQNHKQYDNHALQLVCIIDKGDDFWMNLDEAKAYVSKKLLKALR